MPRSLIFAVVVMIALLCSDETNGQQPPSGRVYQNRRARIEQPLPVDHPKFFEPILEQVGDASLATFPSNRTPVSAPISFAALNQLITQVSWVRLGEGQ